MPHTRIHIFLVATLALFLCALPVLADERPQVAQTARSIGLGGALTGLADDASATFWNPSGIPGLQRQEIFFSYADRYGIGLQNSQAGYVFPLFERHALGLNWSREGFSDTELSDALQVFNFSYGFQPYRVFSVGLSGKFVSQNIDLNGASLRSATGFGFDIGVLFTPRTGPWSRFRLGATLQDVTGTSVQDNDTQAKEEIFPQTPRFGAAFKLLDDLSLSVDVDNAFHFGTEYQPLVALVLRGGVNRDLSPPTGADKTLAFALGFGLRWNSIKLDYAFEHHPVLPATHHAAVSFSYNTSLVSIKDALVRPSPVFKSLYRTYEESDFVDVVLRNASQESLPVTVSIEIPTLTQTPHEETITLAPQSTQRYGFRLTFPQDLLATQSSYYDNLVQPNVKVTYTRGRSAKTTSKRLSSIYVLGKGKLSWSNPSRIGAFITPESRTVDAFARGVVSSYVDLLQQKFQHNNIGKAALVFDALSAYGLRYQQDQTTPYLEIFEDDSVFDTVKYPYEFLQSKIGDCDDCTAIYCSMLENLNIPTAILDVNDPQYGHIYMMFDSGIPISKAGDFFVNEKEYVIWEGRVWIPVETTLFGSSFTDAWRNGAKEYHIRKERGFINELLVSEAQQTFKPGVVPDIDISLPSQDAIDNLFNRDLAFFDNRLDQIATASGVSLDTAEGLYDAGSTYLRLGQLDRALDAFNRALEMDPTLADAYNARGVIFTRRREYDKALEMYEKALEHNSNDAGFRINVAITYHLQGRKDASEKAYQEALNLNQDFSGVLDFIGKAPSAAIRAAAPAVDPLQKLAAEKAYDDGAAYLRLNALDKALDSFNRALELDPNNAEAYNARGVVQVRKRNYDDAAKLFNSALAINPNHAGFHANLAILYHLQGKKDLALQAYQRAVEFDPSTYRGQFDFLPGSKNLTQAKPSQPASITPLQKLAAEKAYDDGAAYLRLNALDKALDAFNRALALDSEHAEASNAKGVVLIRRRQYTEAVDFVRKAVALDTNNAGFHANLAILYHLQGKKDLALQAYQRAIELDPTAYRGQFDFLEE
ncbi:MAG: tetratricopeptide repeat protein [bacterium]|nr:tetratricopeptide repeat protein [bacterium]